MGMMISLFSQRLNCLTNMRCCYLAKQCLALAAAAGVASSDVIYVQLSAVDRFETLQSGRVDVLLTSDTITMQRTVFEVRSSSRSEFSREHDV